MKRLSRRLALTALATVGLAGALPVAQALAQPAPAAAPLSPDDTRLTFKVIEYLKGIPTAQGRFVQTDARGAQSTGTFYLQRPGEARFDYDPPSGLSIASENGQVAVVDKRLKTIQVYPLSATPLALFLDRDISLDKGVKVLKVVHGPGAFTMVAVDGRHKTAGSIAIDFASDPIALTGWTLTDARGGRVKVRLEKFAASAPHDPAFFHLADPHKSSTAGGQ